MSASLTNPGVRCKACTPTLALVVTIMVSPVHAADQPPPPQLRDCVRSATSADAVALCESRHQRWLKQRIETLTNALARQLSPAQQASLDRNVAAWEAYFEQEVDLLDLTLKARSDGLASRLRPGVISRLLEQREQQLREYLHNLKL